MNRISLPAMNVFYDGRCGPYVDRLGGTNLDGPDVREFTQNGVRWMSILVTDQIGNYTITQGYYLGENGELDAHIFSKGVQCNYRHDHYPFWRMDFAISGDDENDVISRATSSGSVDYRREFSVSADAAAGHGWKVRDTVTGDSVSIDFDDGGFSVGGTVIPETDYEDNQVFGRQYRSSETEWSGGATRGLFGDEDQTMSDPVLWYSGYMPHTVAEGPNLWHSTGIRLTLDTEPAGSGSIGNRVVDTGGEGVEGVAVDLFTDGRTQYLESTTTSASGEYEFEVDPGCYTVTFVSPSEATFVGGSRYRNRDVCVSSGEVVDNIDAELEVVSGPQTAFLGDTVTDTNGSAASGVAVDLFTSNSSGDRLSYIRSTTIDGSGNYEFEVGSAGCYAVTFIAPSDRTFADSQSRWLTRSTCVQAGEVDNSLDAVLDGVGTQSSVGGSILESGGQLATNVFVNLFTANGDGSRGAFLGSDENFAGTYQFPTEPGCYVVNFVAPTNRRFVSTRTQYQESFVCLASGEVNDSVDAVLE